LSERHSAAIRAALFQKLGMTHPLSTPVA